MAGSESPLTPRRRLRNELWLSRQAGWWRAYADVAPGRLLELIDYETAASTISQFELIAVPGILQTEAYARAVLRASYDAGSLVERLVALRGRRRDLLVGEGAPAFLFVLDESVIRRPVGSPATMADQLMHLITLAGLPNVTIRVVPFTVGLHPGSRGSVKVIEFDDDPDRSVAFLEGLPGDVLTEDPAEVSTYSALFRSIAQVALEPADSADLLREAAGELT